MVFLLSRFPLHPLDENIMYRTDCNHSFSNCEESDSNGSIYAFYDFCPLNFDFLLYVCMDSLVPNRRHLRLLFFQKFPTQDSLIPIPRLLI